MPEADQTEEAEEEIPSKKKKKAKKILKADIPTRLGLDEITYQKVPNKDPFINKLITNEVIPQNLKKAARKHQIALTNLLNVDRTSAKPVEYGDALYFGMPEDPRGFQLMMIREA